MGPRIPEALKKMKNLRTLNFTNAFNRGKVETTDFDGLENLEVLNLGGNEIDYLAPDAFTKLPKLKSLTLGPGNYFNSSMLFDAVNRVPSLEQLDLSRIYLLQDIPDNALDKLKNLKSLSVRRNQIFNASANAFAGLESLEHLDLSIMRLTELEPKIFSPLNNLKTLSLRGNYIEEIDETSFMGLSKLEDLNMGYNEFTSLPADVFSSLKSLKTLNLEHNKNYKWVDPDTYNGLDSLETLLLNESSVSRLQASTFKPLKNLQYLDLSANPLSSIDKETFKFSPQLKQLHLANTTMKSITPDRLDIPSLQTLDVSNNQWICDDNLADFVKFIQSKSANAGSNFYLANQKDTVCDRPYKLRGKTIGKLPRFNMI